QKSTLNAGFDVFYDGSAKRILANDALPFGKLLKGGMVVGHELLISKISLLTQLNNTYAKRLKLISITEIGMDGTEIPPYEFTYNSQALPSRISNAQDYWGYCNGRLDNWTGVPGCWVSGNWLRGAVKDPDPSFVEAGMLVKITYPTGGHTLFDYEAHTYGYIGNKEINEIGEPTYETTPVVLRLYSENINTEFTLTIDYEQDVTIDYGTTDPDLYVFVFNGTRYLITKEFETKHLKAGEYTVELRGLQAPTGDEEDNPDITINYSEISNPENPTPVYSKSCGGVRIKQITSVDNLTNTRQTRVFYYDDPDPAKPNGSSGVLVSAIPNYTYTYTNRFQSPPLHYIECDYMVRCDYAQNQLTTSQGSHITYREVKEKRLTNGKLEVGTVSTGWTTYKYTSAYDYPPFQIVTSYYPSWPAQDFSWKWGLLTEKKIGTDPNTVVLEENYNYFITNAEHYVPGIKAAISVFCDKDDCTVFNQTNYYLVTGKNYLYRKTTRNYLNDPLRPMIQVEEYCYNFTKNLLLGSTTRKSDGQIYLKCNYYPGYIPINANATESESIGIENLSLGEATYLVNEPLYNGLGELQYSIAKGKPLTAYTKISETIRAHKLFNNEIVAPSFVKVWNEGDDYTTKVTFDAFNNKGHLKQYTTSQGEVVSIIWGV
ncbi:MAG: hypothetical protein HC831_15105, partial [Chloroflexia bacterium]|nr:hypothetical protein [Chloroflexia bacterium]